MEFRSINPYSGECVETFAVWSETQIERALANAQQASAAWCAASIPHRATLLKHVATQLRAEKDQLAATITAEMGKLKREALAEIEKCALNCDYYADNGAALLEAASVSDNGATHVVMYQPLGVVLAVMPWNFPFWQVFRCLAPILLAGNVMLLKHASNVSGCALAIERILLAAGLPMGVFQTLLIPSARVEALIADERVAAVTLTGSEQAGRAVARQAGANLKKAVVELGGSDPFVVLADADLDVTVAGAVLSRFQNAGQSCIAAKRFIVVDAIADKFAAAFVDATSPLIGGDPRQHDTRLAPLANVELCDVLSAQVADAIAHGAKLLIGGARSTDVPTFFPATILDDIIPSMRVWSEEVFGPVATIIRVRDEAHALQAANDSRFGLGGSVWTADHARGENFAIQLQTGMAAINRIVKSDPRWPFGGVKASGFGRELGVWGIREFTNIKHIAYGD